MVSSIVEKDYIMETVNERRKFVKGVGLFAALFAGGSAAVCANTNTPMVVPSPVNDNNNVAPVTVVEDISHLAPPSGATTLSINGAYGEKPKPVAYGNEYYATGINTQPTSHSVAMTVGLDNRLWIKVDDQWKRVALEG
jgi:hypothetical protein